MIEQNKLIISGSDHLSEARSVMQLAVDIYEKIDPELLPGAPINLFYPNGKIPKGLLVSTVDFINDFRQTWPEWSQPKPIEPERVYVLEKEVRSIQKGIINSRFVTRRLMLGNSGNLIKHSQGKHDNYSSYEILNEKTIEDPKHIRKLLGQFATKNSIGY